MKHHLSDRGYAITGENVSPGRQQDQSAYRAELSGLLGVVLHAESAWGTASHRTIIKVGCDCLSAIRVITTEWEADTAQTPHGDLIHAVRSAIRQSRITWHFHHVRGHQDTKKGAQLDHWEQMNVDMDERAKKHWERTRGQAGQPGVERRLLPWQVRIGGQWVPHRIQSEVIWHCTANRLDRHWEQVHQMPPAIFGQCDHMALSKAARASSAPHRVWLAKWTSGHYGHSRALQRWEQRTTDKCPRCGKPEGPRHLLVCSAPSAQTTWRDALAALYTWMEENDTSPAIRRAIQEGIEHWRSPMWHSAPSVASHHSTARAVGSQNDIGWQGIFFGWIAAEWQHEQRRYWERNRSRKSAGKWASTLIRRIWEIPWKQWVDRNDTLHRQKEGEHHKLKTERVDEYIRRTFDDGPAGLPALEQGMFRRGKAAVLALPAETKEAWMRSIEAARRADV